MSRRGLGILSLWIAVGAASFARAATVRPMNVEELTDAADRIFVGTVTSVRSEEDERGLPAVVTVFRVEEVLKGSVGTTVTVRQLGRRGPQGAIVLFAGLPNFRQGQRTLLFLPVPGSLGLASPIGLEQGVFRAAAGKEGGGKGDAPVAAEPHHAGLLKRLKGRKTQEVVRRLSAGPKDARGNRRLTLEAIKELVRAHRGTGP